MECIYLIIMYNPFVNCGEVDIHQVKNKSLREKKDKNIIVQLLKFLLSLKQFHFTNFFLFLNDNHRWCCSTSVDKYCAR